MSDRRDPIPLQVGVSPAQLVMIDGFQRTKGLASREQAMLLLLDIALESVTGTGRRYWDRPIIDPEPKLSGGEVLQARELADRLRAEGHHEAAEQVHAATAGTRLGDALLEGLREACQTALTTIEALDPKTALMAEELRLEVDRRLSR